jgi:formylglycine-generating enzyme required for sulfatase activity
VKPEASNIGRLKLSLITGLVIVMAGFASCYQVKPLPSGATLATPSSFDGTKSGDARAIMGVQLRWCPAGVFVMGSPRSERERRPGENQVQVMISKGFWIAGYETTQAEWKTVMGTLPGELTAELPEGDKLPVGNVNFAEAEEFCRKLTDLAHIAGVLPEEWEFRLPTEAQWEYAARAGTTTATAFGDSFTSYQANFKGQSYNTPVQGPALGHATAVGSYAPNGWGIYDMHGNIWEWTRDWYHLRLPGGADPDLHDAMSTATKSESGTISRSRRGGGWTDEGWALRSAFRLRFEPDRRFDHIGFRVVAVRL